VLVQNIMRGYTEREFWMGVIPAPDPYIEPPNLIRGAYMPWDDWIKGGIPMYPVVYPDLGDRK
jgi:hypothetical protein